MSGEERAQAGGSDAAGAGVARVARPPILDSIVASSHVVIEASAGTGKTYTLEHLVVELVLVHRVPIEKILVVTFTDKATREMRERMRRKLREVSQAPDDPAAADGSHWTIDEPARRVLAEALAVFDRAPISTIHAFCQRILTESAFECARLLRQQQIQSRDAFGEAFRAQLRVDLAEGAPLRPILERAIAAWGVEAIEDGLYDWYAERGAPEPRFDRALFDRALRTLPDRAALSPNGLASRLLAQGLRHPVPKKEVPARLRALAPVAEALRSGGEVHEALLGFWDWAACPAPNDKDNLAYLRAHLASAAGRAPALGPLADAVETLGRIASTPNAVLVAELLPQVVLRLSGRKSERGHFDFDDMLGLLRDALYAPGGEPLVGELRRRYSIALVDEFQDTDRVQWDVFRKIFFEAGTAQRLIVIGDPKQAIYGFRNADVHTYHAAREAIVARGGSVVPLTVSFRARPPLVEAVNRVLEGFFSGVNAYEHPVTCGRPAAEALGPDGRPLPAITLLHFVGRPALGADRVRAVLGERIAEEIGRLLATARIVEDDGTARELHPHEIHVLCRSGTDADAVGRALAAARIPHAFYKREGLFQTAAARDIFVLLRAIESPHETVPRLDAWLTPFFAVPLDRIAHCRDLPPEHPLLSLPSRWAALADSQQWARLFRSMLEDSGLVRRELFAGAGERRLTDYRHIFEILLEESHRGRRSLPELVTRLRGFIEERELPVGESGNVHRLESERRAVQILTMHKSKGLEAEIVFLAGGLGEPGESALAPRVYHGPDGARVAWMGAPTPEVDEALAREKREEAERLGYVAITRARSALYLPYFGPPPPGAPVHPDAAYELSLEPAAEEMRAQLSLVFEDPQRAPPAEDPEYQLRRMTGPYRVLNDRLVALVAAGVTSSHPALFSLVEVPVFAQAAPRSDARAVFAGWRPPEELSHEVPDAGDVRARLVRSRAGFEVTSYTRMKRAHGGFRAPDDEAGAGEVDAALPSPDDALPGGTAVGVLLHEVLEHLPFELVRGGELCDGRGRAIVERIARRHGREELVDPVVELVESSLRAPLVLADGSRLPGLCTVERSAAEVPFLLPIPERGHPTLAEPPPGPDRAPLAIERGYLRGVIDLLLEHEGRCHVLDYKSDRLPSYAADALASHVERNYLVQARLYTLGTLRMLGIGRLDDYERRFGGVFYAFLRGMRGGAGTWAVRPSWDEVLAWERALYDDAPWGHPLPPRRAVARP